MLCILWPVPSMAQHKLATCSASYLPVHMHNEVNFLCQRALGQVLRLTHSPKPILLLINIRYLFSTLFMWSIHLNVTKGMTTPVSSFESGWSNLPTEGGVVSIEQYRTLQARFNEISRENSNLVKEHIRLEAKNTVLKYVLLLIYKTSLIQSILALERHMNTCLSGCLFPLVNTSYLNAKTTP